VENNDGSFFGRHQFLLYRLFSLTGVVPIGGYVIIHLLTNSTVVDSPQMFQKNVNTIHSLGMFLPLVEWTFIFLPLIYHALIGWAIISGSMPNLGRYHYASNFRYTLQRATGMIAFFFIIWHVWHMHSMAAPIGGGNFDPHHAASSTAIALIPLWVKGLYLVGVLAAAYHLANGIWTFGLTWGLWTSPKAMRRASFVCLMLGLGVSGLGVTALVGFGTLDIPEAKKVETRMDEKQRLLNGQSPSAAVAKDHAP